MPRQSTGSIRQRVLSNGQRAFYARFSAYGQRREVLLGQTPEWTLRSAELELENILADVRREVWRPHGRVAQHQSTPEERDPLLWIVMTEFVAAKTSRLRAQNSVDDLTWIVSNHLLPFWARYRLSEAGNASLLDRYRARKMAEGTLGATSINRSIQRLAEILDWANRRWPDSGLDGKNPARDKESRMQRVRPDYHWLEVSHIKVLLEAAMELEENAKREDYRRLGRPAIIAALAFAGPRNTELCNFTWSEIDFDRWLINIPDSKTVAGIREVNIVKGLMPYLRQWRERTRFPDAGDPVFPTAKGTFRNKDNLIERIIEPVVTRAREKIDGRRERGGSDRPLPAVVTPQTFRRSFCALCFEAGESLNYVMAQLGHLDPRVTTTIYGRVMSRRGPKPPEIKRWMAHPEDEEASFGR